MNARAGGRVGESLFSRVISRARPAWLTGAIALLFLLMAFGSAALDGVLPDLFQLGRWRVLLLPPAVIVYILVVAPVMERQGERVIASLRPLVLLDDSQFSLVLQSASRRSHTGEVIAMVAGIMFGVIGQLLSLTSIGGWVELYQLVMTSLMFGLLAWTLYGALLDSRRLARLYRQPLKVDIFDGAPFEPIGHQSLSVSLIFVGGIVLGTVLGLGYIDPFAWQNWLVYGVLTAVPIAVFFFSMRDTHRLMADAKAGELAPVQRAIIEAGRALMYRIAAGESTSAVSAELSALTIYEARLLETRTWPYDTAMLRTLFFSVILPGAAAVGRMLVSVFLE